MLEKMQKQGVIEKKKADELIAHYHEAIQQHYQYITTYGVDPIELEEWHWDAKERNLDDAIQLNILKKSKIIAIVGLSKNPDRYSYKVAHYLQEKGYTIIPVNPHESEVLNEKAYPDIVSIPKNKVIDMVAVYRKSEEVAPHVAEIIKRGNIKNIWFPEGVRNKQAEADATKAGITVVSDFCIMKEHQKLQEKRVTP
jgi:predicted CoA-binding protein